MIRMSTTTLFPGMVRKGDSLETLSVLRLKGKLGEVSPEDLDRILEGLNEIIA